MKANPQECCPKFDPAKWDEKSLKWKNKKFIKESIPTFFHMPFPRTIGKKVTKMMKLANEVDALSKNELDDLLLFNDPTAFKSDLYLSVNKEVPKAMNRSISGSFEAKVYDGPYGRIPKFMKEMNKYLEKKDKKANDYYIHYAYCPKCAKKFGHNYMILFAQVKDY